MENTKRNVIIKIKSTPSKILSLKVLQREDGVVQPEPVALDVAGLENVCFWSNGESQGHDRLGKLSEKKQYFCRGICN